MSHPVFSNASQYMDWISFNCEHCAKSYLNTGEPDPSCAIEAAIELAAYGDGTVSDDIMHRAGALDHAADYCWRCPEREEQP